MREDDDRLRDIKNGEVLVCSVLEFVMDHINNLKVKEPRVLIRCHFGSEELKGTPNNL